MRRPHAQPYRASGPRPGAQGPDAPPVGLAPHAAPPCRPLIRASIYPLSKVNGPPAENYTVALAAQ